MQIRAAVDMLADGPHVKNSSIVLATVEVFDTESGHTAFLAPGTTLFLQEVDPAPAKPAVQSQTERFHWFGMTGITRDQTARMNVVLVDDTDSPAGASYASGLWIETFFYDGDGRVISRSAPRPLQDGIAYGHEMTLCPSDPSMPTEGSCMGVGRTEIRATVRIFSDSKKAMTTEGFRVVSTLEIYDGDGRTQTVAVPAVQ